MSDSPRNSETVSEDGFHRDPEEDISELRNLILGPASQRLDKVQLRLDDPDHRAEDISRILPRAVTLSSDRSDDLASALSPITEQAIRSSIKKDRQIFVDVLFPVMGPAIRKAIAATLQGLIQNFNQILDHSLSIKGLRWRLEALRTRRPFAEVVLLHTLVYQVEQVFLIHRESGLLIEHVVAKTAAPQDPDLVSGMLTAIKDFVQDSFGAAQEDTLDTFQVGDRKVWIEHGAHAMLALVISGNPSIHLREMMRDVLDEIHINHSEDLFSFDGDTVSFAQARPILKGLLQVQFKVNERRRPFKGWILVGIGLLLACWGLVHWMVQKHKWSQFIDMLHAQPGIVLTEIKTEDGKHHLYGLRDPFAPQSAQLIEAADISSDTVEFHWEPYQSAYPDYTQLRFKKLFKPPASVDLAFDGQTMRATGSALYQWLSDTRRMARLIPWIDEYDDYDVVVIDTFLNKPDSVKLMQQGRTLHASGSAPRRWIAETRVAVRSLSGIKNYDDTQLVDADQQEWDALAKEVNAAAFYFESGRAVLMPGQENNLQVFIKTVKRLIALSDLLNRPIKIEVKGHADRTGNEAYNEVISRRRAKSFVDLLAVAQIDRTFFSLRAAGSQELTQPEINEKNRTLNRRVVFKVLLSAP
ncbi:MAG: OmpA family protein [Desulfobacteraceae bacterium]